MTPEQKKKFWNTFFQFPAVLAIATLALLGGAISLLVSTSAAAITGAWIVFATGAAMLVVNALGSYLTRNE